MKDYTPRRTWYRDVWYKSKLEATWAAFFHRRGIEYKYEPFIVQGIYTPDFAVRWPGKDDLSLIEIKPAKNKEELATHKKRCEYVTGVLYLFGRSPRVGGLRWDGLSREWVERTHPELWLYLGDSWAAAKQQVVNAQAYAGMSPEDIAECNQRFLKGLRLPRG